MKTLSRFVTKFTHLIVAVLSCFDRVIFKGHLAINRADELQRFVDYVLKLRRADFLEVVVVGIAARLPWPLPLHRLALSSFRPVAPGPPLLKLPGLRQKPRSPLRSPVVAVADLASCHLSVRCYASYHKLRGKSASLKLLVVLSRICEFRGCTLGRMSS